MTNVYLCIGKLAVNPLFMEDECINIYSVEELCYYIYNYVYLLDDSFVTERMALWLDAECGLEQISRKTGGLVGRPGALLSFIRLLRREVGYIKQESWDRLEEEIGSNNRMPVEERRKIRADSFLKEKRYATAIDEYIGIIRDNNNLDVKLKAKIYHNLGTCMCNLFMFERAAQFFISAYNTYENTESYRAYLSASKMYMSPQDYICFLSDNPDSYEDSLEVERNMEYLKLAWKENPVRKYLLELDAKKQTGYYYDGIESMLEELKCSYRETAKR